MCQLLNALGCEIIGTSACKYQAIVFNKVESKSAFYAALQWKPSNYSVTRCHFFYCQKKVSDIILQYEQRFGSFGWNLS